ncbi:transcription factor bHLH94-like [Primulina tabacum]|uniref:transcription factor bHLH94-like n=1 Tax=Primulina tabacum TaxID=48773 RepID=UPI003F5AC028
MALESVLFRPNPISYGCQDHEFDINIESILQETKPNAKNLNINVDEEVSSTKWDFSPPQNTSSSPETEYTAPEATSRRKRRRSRSLKNREEMEKQRMTHIAVERNRRRLMNEYLTVLRSLMPPSYAQRGDQASIVGGAINFVKELEQQVQYLEGQRQIAKNNVGGGLFSEYFISPQYSTSIKNGVADIEVTMVESHANIKISVSDQRRPKQLPKMVAAFHSIRLTILHLNVTTVHQSALYSFSVKVEDECQLSTVNEIATAVHELIQHI